MFNVYSFEQQARKLYDKNQIEEANARVNSLSQLDSNLTEKTNRMVQSYKLRVAKFLREQTEEPTVSVDQNTKRLVEMTENISARKGSKEMHYKAHRTDTERGEDQHYINSRLDTNPPANPEHKNWSMRPRDRRKELGPEFRFSSNLQIERVLDSLNKETTKYFDNKEIMYDTRTKFDNDAAMMEFKKTRQYNFTPGLRAADYDSKHDLSTALQRKNKIAQTTFVIPPRKMMSSLHRKTYFNAAQSIKLGVNCMAEQDKGINEDFIEMANNLPAAVTQKQPSHPIFASRSVSDCSNAFKQAKQSPLGKSLAKGKQISPQKNQPYDPDEEDARLDRLQKMRNKKIDYSGLTNDILKMTNQQRQPMAASQQNFLKKGHGAGGWGGHFDETSRINADYGKKGFGPRQSYESPTSLRQTYYPGVASAQAANGPDMGQGDGRMTQSCATLDKSLVKSESRGLLVRKKNVILRKELRGLPISVCGKQSVEL